MHKHQLLIVVALPRPEFKLPPLEPEISKAAGSEVKRRLEGSGCLGGATFGADTGAGGGSGGWGD